MQFFIPKYEMAFIIVLVCESNYKIQYSRRAYPSIMIMAKMVWRANGLREREAKRKEYKNNRLWMVPFTAERFFFGVSFYFSIDSYTNLMLAVVLHKFWFMILGWKCREKKNKILYEHYLLQARHMCVVYVLVY